MAFFRKLDSGWEYRISYKDMNGKFKEKSKRGFRTKKEAEIAASEIEKELVNGIIVDKEQTLADYYSSWSEVHKKPNVSSVTWKKYE